MPKNATHRSLALSLAGGLTVVLGLGVAGSGVAQRHHRDPPPPPISMEATAIEWTTFVAAYRDAAASRTVVPSAVTVVSVPDPEWTCQVDAPVRARLNETTWSEVRQIECTRAGTVVATSGFCQVVGGTWGARAAVLTLGAAGAPDRLQITLDCEVRN